MKRLTSIMSAHNEAESIDQSTFSSDSDEEESNPKQLNPIDFLVVTRIPKKTYKFRWIIRQFSLLSKNEALYSTCIHVLDTSCYRLKLFKYEHGYGLFHVKRTREQSHEPNIAKSQCKAQSNETKSVFGDANFQFGSSTNETKNVFGYAQFQHGSSGNEAKILSSNFTVLSGSLGGQTTSAYEGPVTIAHSRRPRVSKILSKQIEPTKVQDINEFNVMLEYKVSATDTQGKELMKWSACLSGASESQSCKIGEYTNNTLEKYPDDCLILDCNLKLFLAPISEEIPIAFKPSLECNGWKKLSKDLKALYRSSLGTDVTLVVGNEKILAHKAILSIRSTIFNKIFHHDMKEAEQNSVSIMDVQFSTLQKLVEFLYSGDILDGYNKDMNLEELCDLYYAADKYQVMDLRQMVGNTLLERIEVDNVSEMLLLADRHNDEDLKSKIENFILISFEEVSNTDTWKSFTLEHPRLAVEVLNFYIKNQKR